MDVKETRRRKLAQLIAEFGTTEVANRASTAPNYISQIATKVKTPKGTIRQVGDQLARKIEAGFLKPNGWMDQPDITNVKPSRQSSRQIPIINLVQAGSPKEVIDSYEVGNGNEMLQVDEDLAKVLSPYAFALQITGESMYNPNSPDCFYDGDTVIIDPNIKPAPGDFVVAKLDQTNDATFKKYRSRGVDSEGHHVFELVPLNDDYETITVSSAHPGHIVGTMIEHRKRRRR